MRRRLLICLALLTATVAGVLAAAPATAPPANPNEPIVTRQNVFSIPFRIDQPKSPDDQPVEVQLIMSADHGATWNESAKAKPEQGNFVFRAPHDGDYWFSLRTVDKQGRARPDGPPRAELKVLVDTVPPRLDLTATLGARGEVIVGWQIVDPNLKPDSLKIEVQSGAGESWEAVPIDSSPSLSPPDAAPARPRLTLVGRTTCWPKAGKGPMTVRAQVADSAGNLANNQVQPKTDTGSSSGKTVGAPDPKLIDPKLSGAPGAGSALGSAPRTSEQPIDGVSARRQWPPDGATKDPLSRANEGPSVGTTARAPQPTTVDWRAAPVETPLATSTPTRTASTQLRAESNGATTQRERDTRGGGKTVDLSLLPPGEHPKMVAARSFDLEYEVDAVGASGVAKVELWGTRDGGRTWSSFGVDTDNRSPIRVNVDGEGIYGFRIVVQSGNGLGGVPPRDGELAEIWVGVDTTRPIVRVTSAAVQPDTGELLVRWEASDDLMDQRPISLSFSDQPNGTWAAIASGIENTGSYFWRLDNRTPDKIYLRLEARDQAGNVGTYVSPEPVLLDRQRPQGRIRGIRPVNDANR